MVFINTFLKNIYAFLYGDWFFNRCHWRRPGRVIFSHYDHSTGRRTACPRVPNSGSIVFKRSLWLTVWLSLIAYLLNVATNPLVFKAETFSLSLLRQVLNESIPWFGAIWGAIYFFRYQQFSSQWRYLAEMYNAIKEGEIRLYTSGQPPAKEALESLARWKAGFIELAEDLHLATKQPYVSLIKSWGEDQQLNVGGVFMDNFPGGEARFRCLMDEINKVLKVCEADYLNCHSRLLERQAAGLAPKNVEAGPA
ncbi:MAG: hypothetical protein OEV92_06490 [Nitrospinota bacterium]|nr:hypothetical protein [Nitrospinota bacterium]